MGGLYSTRRYTLVHGFYFFKLFFVGPKELINLYACVLEPANYFAVNTRINRGASVRMYVYVSMCVCVHARVCVCTCACEHMCVHVHECACGGWY